MGKKKPEDDEVLFALTVSQLPSPERAELKGLMLVRQRLMNIGHRVWRVWSGVRGVVLIIGGAEEEEGKKG